MTIRVLVNGVKGRMGREVSGTFRDDPELELVAGTDLGDDLAAALSESGAQVAVDFTVAGSGYTNAKTMIAAGVCPVIGTSGIQPGEVSDLENLCREKALGGVIAPNFAIGAVLMMRFAAEAARHLPHVEIIELHHDRKVDAPSATAVKTAQMIEAVRPKAPPPKVEETELAPGARGTKSYPVTIHSVRLPGLVAHQEVILGGIGETLTVRHDSISRESFMSGVTLAVKRVMKLDELVYGLENLL